MHEGARSNSWSCLLAAILGCTIFDLRLAFGENEDNADLAGLISTGGVSIWKEGYPVHQTDTSYGDITEYLLDIITGHWPEEMYRPPHKCLESVVTRSTAVVQQRPLPGWRFGGNQGGSRGHGHMSGQLRAEAGEPKERRRCGVTLVPAAGPLTRWVKVPTKQ